jgi:hypothetical protein
MQEDTVFIVYIQFFALIERLLKRNYGVESQYLNIHHFFILELTEIGLRSSERSAVAAFYKKPVGILNTDFEPKSHKMLKDSVRTLYIKLCNNIGPVEADKLFSITLDKISISNAGKAFPPRLYLL